MTASGFDEDAAFDEVARRALARGMDERATRLAPGSIAAVSVRGEVRAVLTHGSPRADGTPTARDTVFRIASMSKSFLSAAVLVLRDRGLLDLHAPITEYVPFARARHHGRDAVMTGDLLLSNRSGLAEDNAWVDRHLGASRAEIASLFGDGMVLAAPPGAEYQYSNLGQALLGRAVESVTGHPVEDVVREVLLEPLGLRRTAPVADGYPPESLARGFRTFDDGGSFRAEPFVGSGALACIGSMFSTVDDIATWMWFLGSAFSEEPTRPDVLAPSSRLELQRPRTPISVHAEQFDRRDLSGAGYGYGLIVEDDRRFGRIVQHSGGLPGFSSHMRWHGATGTGVVVFGNSDEFAARRVAATVLGALLHEIEAPSAVIRPWPETVAAARAIDESLRQGRGMGSLPFRATNLLQDVPADVREARLAAQVQTIGGISTTPQPFEERIVTAATESDLRWRIGGESGDLLVEMRMIGLSEPRVQSLAISAVERGRIRARDDVAAVEDHRRVLLPEVPPPVSTA